MTTRRLRRAAETFNERLAQGGMAVTDVSEKDGVPTITITKADVSAFNSDEGEGDQMAGAKTADKGLQLHDNIGRDIEPEHARLAFSGDVFLSWEANDLPPMGAEAQITVKGTVSGPVQIKQVKLDDRDVWVTVVKFKAEDKVGQLKVIALPPAPDGEIDLDIPGNGNTKGRTR